MSVRLILNTKPLRFEKNFRDKILNELKEAQTVFEPRVLTVLWSGRSLDGGGGAPACTACVDDVSLEIVGNRFEIFECNQFKDGVLKPKKPEAVRVINGVAYLTIRRSKAGFSILHRMPVNIFNSLYQPIISS